MITKALIIDEPWLSKILNGDKTWEMRSTQIKFRGKFGLIRKGSGQVVGVANLTGVSGPYNNTELKAHYDRHQVGDDLILKPDYKWRHAWELSDISPLGMPVSYIHKNGAVTWVELDDEAVEAIALQLNDKPELVPSPKDRIINVATQGHESSPQVTESEIVLTSKAILASRDEAERGEKINSVEYVPVAKDGSRFTVDTCNKKGTYTVGEKGNEQKFSNYFEALAYLKEMTTAKWRRPNNNGNWGIVSAVDWVSN